MIKDFDSKIRTIQWVDNVSRMVNQLKFPECYEYIDITTGDNMYDAIKTMIVRGAPAIGIAGAHGVVLYALELQQKGLDLATFKTQLVEKCNYLASSRPTAVNLMWAVKLPAHWLQNGGPIIQMLIPDSGWIHICR